MMQRTLQIFIVSIALTGLIFPAYAQDDVQVERVATLEAMVSSLEAEVDQAEIAIATAIAISDDAQDKLDEAGRRANDAFNLYGIFEGIGGLLNIISVLIFVITVVFGAFGITNFRDLRRSYKQAAKNYDIQQAKIVKLEEDVKKSEQERREATEKTLLAQAYLPLGEKLYKANDYDGAQSIYETAYKLAPDDLVLNYRLGYIYTKLENFEQAHELYENVLSKSENFTPALAGLGFVIRREAEKMEEGIDKIKKMNKAEEYLLKALYITPNLLDEDGESWWGVLGGLYRRRGQINDAIGAYEKAQEVIPQSSYANSNLALLYAKNGDHSKMFDTYREVEKLASSEVKQNKKNYWAYADLVTSRFALGQSEQANKDLDQVINTAPKSPAILRGLRETLQELTTILVEKDKIPAIEDAIKRIEAVEAERSAIAKNNEEST
jgi:tetratricopeptide (TPR) repeat protein